jgi:ppGpp synthetase/RelA/SpoT-type nucleotidyltranferase
MEYAELARAYKAERDTYEALAAYAAQQIETALEDANIYAAVSCRAKEVDSFVTKALVGGRYDDPLKQITDKAGIRVVVAYAEQVPLVEGVVRALVTVTNRDQKLDALAFNENGYLGVHLDVHLEAGDGVDADWVGRTFEIQIRTIAQGAWAEISHEQLYKPAVEVPDPLKRRIYRLVALVELFDNEVAGFLQEARSTPGYEEAQALEPLQRELLRLGVRRRPDKQLSLLLAAALVPLYGVSSDRVYPDYVEEWAKGSEDGLRNIVAEAEGLEDANPLLKQPELLLICERLDNDVRRLERAWPDEVPYAWLEELGQSWGRPVEPR